MPIGQKFQIIEQQVYRPDAGTDGDNFRNDSGIILRRKGMSTVCMIGAKYCDKFIDGNRS
jgi:hypothetical protein